MRVRSYDKPMAHQVFVLVVNAGILSSVAHALEQRRFSSIRSTDNKDAEAAIFSSEFRSFSKSERLLQSIEKSFGPFDSLLGIISHIDEGRRQQMQEASRDHHQRQAEN